MALDREEYVEQSYFFRTLGERLRQSTTTQELLTSVRDELLSTSKLNLAIGFLADELRHSGIMATAMSRLSHYFVPFQTFVVKEAEKDRGRFDFEIALQILQKEAQFRADGASPQGIFLYQFECLCRNRLSYDEGLAATAGDPMFNEDWRDWIFTVRRQIGIVDFSTLLYVRSGHYVEQQRRLKGAGFVPEKPTLFGDKEGKIALANRHKDPLFLFAALQRQLGYPAVPRPKRPDQSPEILPQVLRRLERIETRLKLLEEEQKGGIDITKFYDHAQGLANLPEQRRRNPPDSVS